MYKYVKRTADIVASFIGIVLLLPLLAVVGLWVKLESEGPILFKQKRYGKSQVPFDCLKFRTMYIDAPANSATADLMDARYYITASGRLLRRLGLDELPQLINVLKGEMSLIGPRPVVLAEKNLINEREKYGANDFTPGIGGWAQSNGRDELNYKTKARLDGEYAQNFGLHMDVSCIWRTVVAVFTSDGFKEGRIGDTPFKREVQRRTKQLPLHKRVVRKVKKTASARKAAKNSKVRGRSRINA